MYKIELVDDEGENPKVSVAITLDRYNFNLTAVATDLVGEFVDGQGIYVLLKKNERAGQRTE